MDEIEKRLSTSSEACVSAYTLWRKDEKDGKAREGLLEAVHEMRKVAARLEIEMAISERDQKGARPLPIPPHKSSHKKAQGPSNQQNKQPADSGNEGEAKAKPSGSSNTRPRRKRTTGTISASNTSGNTD